MPEYIETRPEAIAAIHESIMHWNDICYGESGSVFARSCGLCNIYIGGECKKCPVSANDNCCHDPMSTWDNYYFADHSPGFRCSIESATEAEAMLEALVVLLPPSERIRYGDTP